MSIPPRTDGRLILVTASDHATEFGHDCPAGVTGCQGWAHSGTRSSPWLYRVINEDASGGLALGTMLRVDELHFQFNSYYGGYEFFWIFSALDGQLAGSRFYAYGTARIRDPSTEIVGSEAYPPCLSPVSPDVAG